MTDDFPPRLNADPFDAQEWADDALCRETDPERYFPTQGDHGYMTRVARRLCDTCRVRVDCLQYALDASEQLEGIWAGTTLKDRAPWRAAGVSALDALYPVDEEEAS